MKDYRPFEIELKNIGAYVETMLDSIVGKHTGFALLVFPFGEPPEDKVGLGADYISNAERLDMIKFLRETADRLEKQEVVGKTRGNA